MRARSGQVAIYLVMVLVAIAVLVFMNVDIFLAIRAKNHAMNAGDAAALAVAKYQGELLNHIGECNIAHLRAALTNDWGTCESIMARQRRIAFLSPLNGIGIGSQAAMDAISRSEEGFGDDAEHFETDKMRKILEQHANEVLSYYACSPELYPEPWRDAWLEYADKLFNAISGGHVAGPENAEFLNAYKCYPLLDQGFYNAIAGEMWCWFKWNGKWIFDCDHINMPRPEFPESHKVVNAEIYSLHLEMRPILSAELDAEWTNIIMRLTGCSEDDILHSYLLTDPSQSFAFYDSNWGSWRDYGFSVEQGFPIVGDVKPEYDVLGCAAVCRVIRTEATYPEGDRSGKGYAWTAAAKPFGTVENLEGKIDVVTCLRGLVVPAFTDARLVPVDSVGGRDLHTADYDWMNHVHNHLMDEHFGYFAVGPKKYAFNPGCWYCQQLEKWESWRFREKGRRWLQYHSDDCVRRRLGASHDYGGTAHAH